MDETDPQDLRRVLQVANHGFAQHLRRVGPDDWSRATPCSAWDVRALVNHVLGANRRYELLLHDAPLEQVEATREHDHVGDDPAAVFDASSAVLLRCFGEPGVLERTFRHAVGERTGHQLLLMRILDVGVHSWDLARAIGSDDRIDDDVVTVALTTTSATKPEGEGTSAQDRLLLRMGRHPTEEEQDDGAR